MSKPIVNPTCVLSLVIRCRARGRGPLEISIPVTGETDPATARAVFELLLSPGAQVPDTLPADLAEQLAQSGITVLPEDAPAEEPVFRAELCAALVPSAAAASAGPEDPGALELAPGLHLAGDVLPAQAPPLPVVPGNAQRSLWIFDAGPQRWRGHELDADTLGALRRARSLGALLELGRPMRELLSRAGIAGPPGFAQRRLDDWNARIAAARRQLQEDGYAVVRGFLDAVEIAQLRRYYRALHEAAAFTLGDPHVELRDSIHEEAVGRFLHRQLLPAVNQLVPEPVQPSYSFVATYHPQAVLRRHTDREQCQWNVSLALDADPETDAGSAWPLYLEPHGVPHGVRLGLGDFVLYSGTTVPHWRDAQLAGHRCTLCFLHFVSLDFAGPLT